MAKRKHSTALFEVITQSTRYSRPNSRPQEPRPFSPGFFANAKEWVKQHSPVKVLANHPSPAPLASHEVICTDAPPHSLTADVPAPIAPTPDAYDSEQSPPEKDLYAQPVAMAVDPENRQIALRMSYSAAFIAVASVLLIVGLSLVIGQHLSRGGVPLLAQTTTAELLKNAPHPEVLEPPRRSSPNSRGNSETSLLHPAPPLNGGNQSGNESHSPSPTAAEDGKRYIGRNYIIVQSYPFAEEKMAKEAAAFLNKEGVNCTIETGVKGYLPITVVGLQGFDKQSSPACKDNILRIQKISAKYTSNSRSYKAFAPVAKKWDKQD